MHLLWSKLVTPCVLYIVLLQTCTASPSYYITAPDYLRAGFNTTFAVYWFGTSYPAINVTAEVSSIWPGPNQGLLFVQKTFFNDSAGLFTLPALPADLKNRQLLMEVTGLAETTVLFKRQAWMNFWQEEISVFIELDKSLYKPRQGVKIRAICVHRDLKPFHGQIDISIRDPMKNLVQQWLAIQADLGVVSREFLLSDIPPFGAWEVRVNVKGVYTTKQFTVTDYVTATFDVAIITPTVYIMSRQENVTGQVTARYRHGELVNGNVTVSIDSTYYYYYRRALNKTYPISGSVNFSFTYEELQMNWLLFEPKEFRSVKSFYNREWLDWRSLNISATVKESLTGSEVTKNNFLNFAISEYVILDVAGPFKPRLNYTVPIKVLRSDLQPLTKQEREKNVSVVITQLNYDEVGFGNRTVTPDYQQYVLPENGELNIRFEVLASTLQLSIQVQYQNETRDIFRSTYFWQSEAFIQILGSISPMQVGSPFEVLVESSENVKELNYVVTSKGQAVAVGKKDRNAFILTPETSWAPIAVITVYYINSSGVIITDSRAFPVKATLNNKVYLSWSKRQAKPAENVSLTITVSEPGSLVGLRVVEKSLAEDRITAAMVMNNRMDFQVSSGQTLSDAPLQNFEIKRDVDWTLFYRNAPSVETNVTETWIWLESNISSGKTINLQVTVPKIINSFVANAFVVSEGLGLGLTSESAEIQVSQELYITLSLPHSVTRGEQFILEVLISNMLEQTLEVTATLELGNSFEIMGASNASTVPNQRRTSVPSQSGRIVFFPVRPKELGEITFTVKANSSAASDVATKTVKVKAEGIQQFYSQSVLLMSIGSTPQTVSNSLSFTFPSNVVNGSEQAYVTVVGDLLGPTIDGLESLIRMPYGCGEQNMINFCPNIYVLIYLNKTGRATPTINEKAIRYMEDGYQRELTYRRSDGSFSAFGNSDISGSTWLSAFVLRCFLQARPFIFIDQTMLEITIMWLVQYQDVNTGEFREPGRVIHTELQGGQNGPITLTAYIVTALLEDSVYRSTYKAQVSKAIDFLEKKFQEGISSNYTLAVVAYALSLANSTNARPALDQLNGRAERTDGSMFWSSPAPGIANYWQPRSSEIEMAAYALLSCYEQNRINEGIPIMRWLSQQRSQFGGYTSTQDTIMGLLALSQFAAISSSSNNDLTVSVTGPGNFVPKSFQITSSNVLVLQRHTINVSQPLSITVSAVGTGIAIFQLNVAYNIMPAARLRRAAGDTDTFTLDITVEDDKNNLNQVTVNICTSYVPSMYGNQSGMALMEVYYLSGFTLDLSRSIEHEMLKKVEPDDGKVNLYFDSIAGTPVCVRVPMLRDTKVSSTKDAVISVMDYYKPRTQLIKLYNSKVMNAVSSCDFCGKDCTLCNSNINSVQGEGGNNGNSNSARALVLHIAPYFLLLVSLVHLYL